MVLVVKNLLANEGDVRDMGFIPGSGRSPGGGHGHLLQYSYLENPLDSGAWWATVHRVEKSQTQLKRLSLQAHKMGFDIYSMVLMQTLNEAVLA